MVSKAREDLPDPLGPVMTTSRFLGRDTLTFFRLCCAALVTTRLSMVARSSTLLALAAEGAGKPQAVAERPTAARSFEKAPSSPRAQGKVQSSWSAAPTKLPRASVPASGHFPPR